MQDIALGCDTTVVMKKNKVPIELDEKCFSIISKNRTLDLMFGDMDIKTKWVKFLYNKLINRKLE